MEKDVFTQTFPIWADRLVSPVRVSDLARNRQFEGRMLWDTGAQMSVISKCVAEACRLKTIPAGTTGTLMSAQEQAWLGVVLVFPGDIRKFVPLRSVVMDDLHTDVDVILGMDVIGRGDFSLKRAGEALQLKFVFGEDFMDA